MTLNFLICKTEIPVLLEDKLKNVCVMSLLLLPQLRERLSYARHMRAYLIILGGVGACDMG